MYEYMIDGQQKKGGGGQKNYTEEKKNKEFTEKERITLHS
jgi:hypothetical protein